MRPADCGPCEFFAVVLVAVVIVFVAIVVSKT